MKANVITMVNLKVRKLRFLSMAATLLLGFSLAACQAESGGGSSKSDTPEETTPNQSTPSTSGPAPEESEESTTAPTEPTVNMSNPAECIIGTWQTNQALFFQAMMAQTPEARLVSVDGMVKVTFKETGKTETNYDDWAMTVEAQGMTVTLMRSGIDTGSYKINNNTIDVSDIELNSKITMNAAGNVMEFQPEPENFQSAPFECSADELKIDALDSKHVLKRI